MSRRLGMLVIFAALAGAVVPLAAQNKDAKGEKKETKAAEPAKMPAKDKTGDPSTTEKPAKLSLDKFKLPPGAILVVTEGLKEAAAQFPQMFLITPEQYYELLEKLRLLEEQLKPERGGVHSRKLAGHLDGDYLAVRAEFTFSTQHPKTPVTLGLLGAHLIDPGELDGARPLVQHGEEGYQVHVLKEGSHQLILNLKTALSQRRGGIFGAAAERGFELSLPGAPAGTLVLDLPPEIKEIRVNDSARKSKTPGRWEVPLGLVKQLSVTWKEPMALLGSGPLASLDAQVLVRLEDTLAQIKADLTLEDPRGQTTEWRLLLPAGAVPTVKTLSAAAHQWIAPDGKSPYHILKLKEPTTDRIAVAVQATAPRSTPRLAVGPFALAGNFRNQGTIVVQAAPSALSGQRVLYHRFGEVLQRDPPKGGGAAPLAVFQFSGAPGGKTTPRAPLELEFRPSPSLVETQTDHTVRLVGGGDAWQIETTTRITAKALADAADFLEVRFPAARLPGVGPTAFSVGVAFPGALPWITLMPDKVLPGAVPVEFRWEENGGDTGAAELGKATRISWGRGGSKQATVTIHGRYLVPAGVQRLRLDLPRAQGMVDRGGRVTVRGGDDVEFLLGAADRAAPAAERKHYEVTHELTPAGIEMAWRSARREFVVTALADVTLHARSAQVREVLQFAAPPRPGGASASPIRLRVPSGIKQVTVSAGGTTAGAWQPGDEAWPVTPSVDPGGKSELVLDYDVAIERAAGAAAVRLAVPLILPEDATRHEAKIRVWSEPGILPEITGGNDAWRDRGLELVPGRDDLPALVVHGTNVAAPLTLQLPEPAGSRLAGLVCDRTLIHVQINEKGEQLYRARFLVRKLPARQLEIELPVNAREHLQAVRLGPSKQPKALNWHSPGGNVARIALPAELTGAASQPLILELEYKAPPSEAIGLWQTVLTPPQFHGEMLAGAVRWQVQLSGDPIPVVLGRDVQLDYRWTFQGWLMMPETDVSASELESWLSGAAAVSNEDAGLAFWRSGLMAVRILHVPRPVWLLICSGLVLAIGLGLYLLPLSRAGLGTALVALVLVAVTLALWSPAALPAVAFGSQPGLAVLAVLLGVQWLVQERYRRQVVFLPGFSRLQPNSVVVANQAKKPREASTVDAPAIAATSPSSVR